MKHTYNREFVMEILEGMKDDAVAFSVNEEGRDPDKLKAYWETTIRHVNDTYERLNRVRDLSNPNKEYEPEYLDAPGGIGVGDVILLERGGSGGVEELEVAEVKVGDKGHTYLRFAGNKGWSTLAAVKMWWAGKKPREDQDDGTKEEAAEDSD